MNAEQKAREQIDTMLTAAGWFVQDYKAFNPSAGRGVALREVPLKSGPCDYLLLVDRVAVGIVEAKKHGTTLSGFADQSGRYGLGLPDFIQAVTPARCPFFMNRRVSKPSFVIIAIPNPVRASCSAFTVPKR